MKKYYVIKNFWEPIERCGGETIFLYPISETTKEEVLDLVKNNACDMYECGAYPYVMVGIATDGFYPAVDEEIQWFKYDEDEEKYKEIDRPKDIMDCIRFMI